MSKPWYSHNGGTRARITAQVFTCYGTVCHLCCRPGADTVDHVVPRSRGGDDGLANLRPTGCKKCPRWFLSLLSI